MKINMQRHDFLKTGIFGMLEAEDESLLLFTLEHAYEVSPGVFAPKIPPGTYTCIRGIHQLEGMTHTFETFEIEGVAGHSNLLFHPGNTNRDSSGCILVGLSRLESADILHSKDAFEKFMQLQTGVDSFALTVS